MQSLGRRSVCARFTPALLVGLVLALSPAALSAAEKLEERYRAFAVAMQAGQSGTLEFVITRWSTEEERALLINTLVQKGQEETVKLLRKQKETGWTRAPGNVSMTAFPSVRLHYAHEVEQDGKRSVVLCTDRPIGMLEAARGGRSLEYDISMIAMELHVEDGKQVGEGKLFYGMKIGYDKEKNTLAIESVLNEPVRLTNIARE